jgi:hypothetical protein
MKTFGNLLNVYANCKGIYKAMTEGAESAIHCSDFKMFLF